MDTVESRGYVVLKFGGTSVSSLARWQTIAEQVRQRLQEGLRPLVVCSAFATVSNSLEELLAAAASGRHEPILQGIVRLHTEMAETLGLDATALLQADLDEIGRLAFGASLTQEVSPRLKARVMAFGELISTRLGAAWLNGQGIETAWLDARDYLRAESCPDTNPYRHYLNATCGFERSPGLIAMLDSVPAPVLITQGFIARDSAGDTVLLGRGGSDTSASYLAALLGAKRCEIWTDVPGIYSANPRQVPTARLLKHLDYDEAQEITSTGAKVLHPRCIPPVRAHGIELHIRCSQMPDAVGTVITSQTEGQGAQVKAISQKSQVTLISMETLGMWQQVGFLADVFAVFKRHGFSIDLVSTSEMNVTVTLDPASNSLNPDLVNDLLRDLGQYCRARQISDCAVVSLVGRHIRAIMHRLGPALELFQEQKIYLVSQAASDLNLTFVVDREQADRLVGQLHELLFMGRVRDSLLGPSWQEMFERPAEGESEEVPWFNGRRQELLDIAAGGPAYVYDQGTLMADARALKGLKSADRILYAVKANGNADVLRVFHEAGLTFECVSPGEIEWLFELFPGLDPTRILFTPNFAPRSEYEFAFEKGVRVTLDNHYPLQAWPELFAGREIFVRLDPGHGRGHHKHVHTAGAHSKFGVFEEELDALGRLVSQAGATVTGLHAHVGSGIFDPDAWRQTALFLACASDRFPDAKILDLGGGLGVPYKPGQKPLDLVAMDAMLGRIKAAFPRFELWLEPGRYLVARAGVLVAPVTQLKQKGEYSYVGISTGMNSLIRPALYGSFHNIVNLSRMDAPLTLTANVVGPICESGDVLGQDRRLPETFEGDILLIETAGAYGRVMSSEYNRRPPAREVFLPVRQML
ncbi:MAG TPA: bifunctional aspartate kinase/diaminopimelate decarboxylase [Myxococcota bacterium]|nr:bifunctional aspartate kinase/diaminopimelate decarboxylase [Myxococcota bacterium]